MLFGCERSCSSPRRVSNFNSNVPQGGNYCGRIDGNYRYKLALSREVLPSSECLDGGLQRSRRVACYRPSKARASSDTRRILWNLRKTPEIPVCGVLQGH